MILTRKCRFKPLFKKIAKIKENVYNSRKILKFKKQKWKFFILKYSHQLLVYKKFKPKDQYQYLVSKYSGKNISYKKKYKSTILVVQRFSTLFGNLTKKSLKIRIQNLLQKKRLIKSLSDLHLLFLQNFEKRLDFILYRAKFSQSLRSAGQLILQGKVLVNSKPIKKKSYILASGDLIKIRSKTISLIENNLKSSQIWPLPPKYLIINYKIMQIIVLDIKIVDLANNFSSNLNLEKLLRNYTYY